MAEGPGFRNICCFPHPEPERGPSLHCHLILPKAGKGDQGRVGRGAGASGHKRYSWQKCLQWHSQSRLKILPPRTSGPPTLPWPPPPDI